MSAKSPRNRRSCFDSASLKQTSRSRHTSWGSRQSVITCLWLRHPVYLEVTAAMSCRLRFAERRCPIDSSHMQIHIVMCVAEALTLKVQLIPFAGVDVGKRKRFSIRALSQGLGENSWKKIKFTRAVSTRVFVAPKHETHPNFYLVGPGPFVGLDPLWWVQIHCANWQGEIHHTNWWGQTHNTNVG